VNRSARTVIITGASTGVGQGDRVGLIAQDLQRELQASGAKAVEWEAVDVSDATALFAAAEQLEQRLGFIAYGSTMPWKPCFRRWRTLILRNSTG
jgi:NADP-dependent 3-hydroxy acid dehydrogenase YdfG